MTSRNDARSVVLFDLLTALLDSWSLWNNAAGGDAAGRAWRAAYLELTYGCGSYRPYGELVRTAADAASLSRAAADRLEANWHHLQPWPDAQATLDALRPNYRLGVVTNCSIDLGRRAAQRLAVEWDVIVTAEEAGHYKPHSAPYTLALDSLTASPANAAFVAGSAYDLIGTAAVGLPTYWHNRVGLAAPSNAPVAQFEARDLAALPAWLAQVLPKRA
jgi:2-haloalkanoic acid dehalogenase type II